MYRHGRRINHSLNQYQNTFALVNSCGFITPVLIVRSFGMSYAKILAYPSLRFTSSIAQRHKRVLTACLDLSKTSDAPSPATCAKTTEEANSYEHYLYPALMDHLIPIPPFWPR